MKVFKFDRRFLKVLLTFSCIFMLAFPSNSFAQEKKKKSGPRRQLATIVFSGLGGAVLGLSTLSFYGRPQEKLSNIAIGFALGVIAGTVFVTYKSATTREYYDDPEEKAYIQGNTLYKVAQKIQKKDVVLLEPEVRGFFFSPMVDTNEHSLGASVSLIF